MTLGDFEILPGVVINTDDPLNQGRVKACAPGLFDTSNMEMDDLFWINPFMMIGQQSFSKMELNSKIWILHNPANYFEYWYIPRFELNENSPEVMNTNSDVLLSRSINGDIVQLYYSKEEGFNLNIGNNHIKLTSEAKLDIAAGSAQITANESGINLQQKDQELHPAAKADEIISALKTFCVDLTSAANAAIANPYTACLGVPLMNAVKKLQPKLDSFKSTFVNIS